MTRRNIEDRQQPGIGRRRLRDRPELRVQHPMHRIAVIQDMQPVTALQPVAVDGILRPRSTFVTASGISFSGN